MKHPVCARCGQTLNNRQKWFTQNIDFNGHGPAVLVAFKVAVERPRGGQLCLRCVGESMVRASANQLARFLAATSLAALAAESPTLGSRTSVRKPKPKERP